MRDLRQRTHLPVERCEIGNVDLLRDCADITIHYRTGRQGISASRRAPGVWRRWRRGRQSEGLQAWIDRIAGWLREIDGLRWAA